MKANKYYPYFRPTRRKHESGYLIIEIGYEMEDGYLPIARVSDVLNLWNLNEPLKKSTTGALILTRFNIDSVKYGYFRIFGEKEFRWARQVMSSAFLEEGAPDYKELEERWEKYKEERNKK